MSATDEAVTFIVPVSDNNIYKENFLSSPLFNEKHQHQILAIQNAPSATKAYNRAIDESLNDILIFVHQDVLFPVSWLQNLRKALEILEGKDPYWGVLGCYGATQDSIEHGYLYCSGNGKILGNPFVNPMIVQTLDEIVLIVRKSSSLYFDETLPYFHFYGTDICMAAADRGMNCYAISAFCFHNSNKTDIFPKEFLKCYFHIRKHWRKCLPIQTTCIIIDRYNYTLCKKYFKQLLKYPLLRSAGKIRRRVKEPLKHLEILQYCDEQRSLWDGKVDWEIFPEDLLNQIAL